MNGWYNGPVSWRKVFPFIDNKINIDWIGMTEIIQTENIKLKHCINWKEEH